MTDEELKQLPESLVDMAKCISPPRVDCERCDISVGFICETCHAAFLMLRAAEEIKKLRRECFTHQASKRALLLAWDVLCNFNRGCDERREQRISELKAVVEPAIAYAKHMQSAPLAGVPPLTEAAHTDRRVILRKRFVSAVNKFLADSAARKKCDPLLDELFHANEKENCDE